MNRRALFSLLPAAALLAGCSTLKKITGQRNDTVLPGQREDILAPDQYTTKNEDTAADPAAEPVEAVPPATTATKKTKGGVCNPEVDPECAPADAGGNDGIFSDG